MKRLLPILCLVILPLFLFAQSKSCLVIDMPFNGDANDQSGNKYHGKVTNAKLVKDRFGCDSSAYYFDGNGDYVLIPNPAKLNDSTSAFTISTWIKPESNGYYNTILAYGNSHGLVQLMTSTLSPGFLFQKINFSSTGAQMVQGRLTLFNSIDTTKWSHLACVFDSTQSSFDVYINGKHIYRTKAVGWKILPKNKMEFWQIGGRSHPVHKEYYKGYIDDVKIYTCALDSYDIKSIYQQNSSSCMTKFCDADFSAEKDLDSACKYLFTIDTPVDTVTYKWYVEDSLIGYGDSMNYRFIKGGVFDVKLATSTRFRSCEDSFTLTLNPSGCLKKDTTTNCLLVDLPFSGNAKDQSVERYQTKVAGATLASDRFFNANSAYYFDGKDDYIEITDPEKLNASTDKVSLSLWYKPEKDDYYNTLVAHGGSQFLMQLVTNTLRPGFMMLPVQLDYTGAQNIQSRLTLYDTSSTTNWTHLVCTFDSANKEIIVYINGVIAYAGKATGGLISKTDSWRIGAKDQLGFEEYYKGFIDDIKMYRCVIDSIEVKKLYTPYVPIDSINCQAKIDTVYDASRCQFIFTASNPKLTGINSVFWDFGDSTQSLDASTQHRFKIQKNYNVSLILTGNNGACTDTSFILITNPKCTGDTSTNCLVVDLAFNGDADDQSAENYATKIVGATLTKDRFGNKNQAYRFDGDDYIEITNPEKLNKSKDELSVSLWYKASSANTYNTLIAHGGANFFMQLLGTSLEPGFLMIPVQFDYTGAYNNAQRLTLYHNSDTTIWTHIVCTYNSNQEEFLVYINGKLFFAGKAKGQLQNKTDAWRIGSRDHATLQEYFTGSIDEVKLYRCAIDSNEVKLLYNNTTTIDTVKCAASISYIIDPVDDCNYTFTGKNLDGTGIGSLSWDFGSSISTGQDKEKRFPKAGIHKVFLELTDSSKKCIDTISLFISSIGCPVDIDTSTNCLIVDMPMDGSAADVSVQAYTTKVEGATLAKDRNDNANSAYYFDGQDDYIEISNPKKINAASNKISVSIWYKPEENGTYNTLLGHGGSQFLMQLIGTELQPGFLMTPVNLDYTGAQNRYGRLTMFQNSSRTDWTHLVCTFDSSNSEIKIYFNGKLEHTGKASGNLISKSDAWRIGAKPVTGAEDYYKGYIDELKIFRCVIDENEVKDLYENSNKDTLDCQADFKIIQDTTKRCTFNFVSTSLDTTSTTNYMWVFGDGNAKSSDSRITHVYENDGNYKVQLLLTDDANDCSSKKSRFLDAEKCKDEPIDSFAACLGVYVDFDGEVFDKSVNQYKLQKNGGSFIEDRFEESSKAFELNGTSDFITIKDPQAINATSALFSTSIWFKAETTNGFSTLLAHGKNQLSIQLYNTENRPSVFLKGVQFDFTSADEISNRLVIPDTVSSAEWNHLVFTFDSARTEIKFYINGELSYTGKATGMIDHSDTDWYIGSKNISGNNEFYQGGLDDISMYKCVLNALDVKLLYQKGTSVNAPFQSEFSLYPNPTTGVFQLDGIGFDNVVIVRNALGQTVTFSETNKMENSRLLNLDANTNGIYYLTIYNKSGQRQTTQKIVLQKAR